MPKIDPLNESHWFNFRLNVYQKMIQNAKKILIETETHEIFVVRLNSRSGLRGYCKGCAAEQDLLTLDESVAFSNTRALELIDVIRRGAIHFLEASGGHLLVCKSSLQNWSEEIAPNTPESDRDNLESLC